MTTAINTTHPHLAAQLVDQALATALSKGSNKRVEWRCDDYPDHIWIATPNNRCNSKNPRCPYCAGKRVFVGLNDLATTHPQLAAQLVDHTLATTISAGSGKKISWQCPDKPQHIWDATPNNRTSTTSKSSGCPYCANKKVLVGDNDLATTHPELAAQLVDANLATTVTAGHNGVLKWRCDKHETEVIWSTSPILRVRQNTRCPVCSERAIAPSINDLATTHPDLARYIADPQPNGTPASVIATNTSRGSHNKITWICPINDKHSWVTTVKDRVRGTGCPECACSGTSQKEADLYNIVTALLPQAEVQQGALINGRTGKPGGSPSVDILVLEKNVAIEFNGLYWHSEMFVKDKDYHAQKSQLAEQAGYQLIHVWEDDWNLRPEIVIRMIAHKLHATKNLLAVLPDGTDPRVAETVFARKLVLTTVSGKQAAAFLNANHIQGAVTATKHFALCEPDTGDIRALLSVRSPRNNARMKRGNGVWEIQRYATLGTVPGGFTRLMKYAEQELNTAHNADSTVPPVLTQWVSFSAHDVSNGDLYSMAGFAHTSTLAPDYKYVGGITQWHRTPKESFQRKRFREDDALQWDESWTEHGAALKNELYRIYDAGKIKWTKEVV